ncbi:sensor histidine kinase [uncultured Robinsoniella sp.]|uniref:sensor histidine kinase n=1 Tax=uncultured Robinsoniella sp. TaxID=904190 RepID=UPI00374FCC51
MKETKSLRERLIPAFLLASLLSITMFAVLSQIRMRINMKQSLNDRIQGGMDKADQCLDMVLDKYETILYDLCTDDEVVAYAEKINEDQDDLTVNSSQLRRYLSHMSNRNSGVEGVLLTLKNGKTIFYDHNSSSSANSSWMNTLQIPSFDGTMMYQAPDKPVTIGDKEVAIFQVVRRIVDYRDIHKEIGTITVSIDEKVLEEGIYNGEDNRIYICQGDTVISAPDKSLIGQKKSELKTKGYRVTEKINEKSGWSIYYFQSMKRYNRAVVEQGGFWIVVTLGTIGILALLTFYFTRPVMKSVDRIVEAMNEAETGDFMVRIPVEDEMPLEIRRIALGFNELMEKIDQLVNQVKQAVLEQKNAELYALEAQIDPHFLYNTLDTINWKAIERDEYEISDMVGALADILRYAVKNAGGETNIQRELYWLEQYVLLQSAKLGKPLKTVIEVPEHMMRYKIHKLLLQPFVENAIKYAFKNKEGDCILKIRIEEADGQLHIVIEDNGKGISLETMALLNNESADMDDHLGIINVRKRLQLYYPGEANIYFESKQNRYTKVHLFIPAAEEDEDENRNRGG